MKKLTLLLLVVAFLTLSMATSLAVTTTVGFKEGPFTISDISINPFATAEGISLTGQDQILETSINPFNIIDARGNNKGWLVRVSATPFEDSAGNRLHEGALSLSDLSVSAVGNSDAFDNTCRIADGISLTSIPQNIIVVPESKGKGTYSATGGKLMLEVWPKEVLATTYISTLTIELVTNIK